MDVVAHIRELSEQRGWTEYRLCKASGVPTTTISNMFHRNTMPTIPTLERICAAFGLTLSEFFAPPDVNLKVLSDEQVKLLNQWSTLADEQKQVLLDMIMLLSKP